MQKTKFLFRRKKIAELIGIALPLAFMAIPAQGDDTDLTNVPLTIQTTVTAKPNLMFILDDSGSMGWDYMPDALGASYNWFGYYSSQCNGVAFDPNTPYPPPLKADGSSYDNITLTAALDDGYNTNSGTTNLKNNFYYTYTGTEPAMSWTYNAATNGVITTTNFYQECATRIDQAKGKSAVPTDFSASLIFTRVLVKDLTAEAKQAYANWYSYYRKRYLLMRTAMGRAVSGLNDDYRVGFSKINSESVTDNVGHFRDVKDFDATQKANFYKSLYGASPGNNTPLRAALSRIGRYYAKKPSTQAYDPVQYSCQRNYALLSTDGYWNDAAGFKLDGTAIGNQDGAEERPMLDASNATNTLADVAEYYYKTDLRTPERSNCTSTTSNASVCENTVRPTENDKATWQHMNTFTIGLGVSGLLTYDPNYLTQTTGAYVDLKNGTRNWTDPGNGSNVRTVDDLWHAAINGRGQYYSALNATALKDAINSVISSIQAKTGSGSGVATTSLEVLPGPNNQVFSTHYSIPSWTGDIRAYTLDGDTDEISGSPTWSAQAALDSRTTARTIYFRNAAGTLQSFEYANLSATQQAHFNNFCTRALIPDQCPKLKAAETNTANDGTNLVNYLRGTRDHEAIATGSTVSIFRPREHLLGDMVESPATFVGGPPFMYSDSGYADFASTQATRKPTVYVGANDGMLHAFSADSSDGGTELWAYVPGQIIANLYRLADTGYSSRHQYFLNGPVVVGDIQVGSTWKTILVGGFGGGGKGYFALDITDPENPSSLWEFTDANMGYSFGNPIITKRTDGTWVVAVTSGYNNNVVKGDGKGHLYLLNANTGAKLVDISTGAGSTAIPSGLSKINAWIDAATDNTAKRFYGGDLLGNLWRFDTEDLVQPKNAALKLATLEVGDNAQPITIKPELFEVQGKAGVAIATGRYLGVGDITNEVQQTVYALEDSLTSTSGWGNPRESSSVKEKTITLDEVSKTGKIDGAAIDWAESGGWRVDLPHSKERVAIDMTVQYSTLAVSSIIPNGDACSSGGSSWIYYFDLRTGAVVAKEIDEKEPIVGRTWKKKGKKLSLLIQMGDGNPEEDEPPEESDHNASKTNRTSWRELVD